MKILHTSDWHIGRTLYGRKRYEEFEAFLAWLDKTINEQEVDVLLVAGDVFDTNAPSNRAQELYYSFLSRISKSCCRHIIIIAGNHDSPSFLNAPKELLKALNVHVVGGSASSLEDEVLVLFDKQDAPELIVCAVPYLRDRDIRTTEAGENIEDKERKLVDGIRDHYEAVATLAEEKRRAFNIDLPIVGMGHLFTSGGRTIDGDGVRELYIGSLAHVTAEIFPTSFNYLALGHLHIPQKIGGREHMRYSGSPLPMGFGEANQKKSVCLVELNNSEPSVCLIDVPLFQELRQITGDWDVVDQQINALVGSKSKCWLEVIYDGDEVIGDLRERLETAVSNTQIEILRIKNNRIIDSVLKQIHEEETLDDLDEFDVFQRCLIDNEIAKAQHEELLLTYQEALASLRDEDVHAD